MNLRNFRASGRDVPDLCAPSVGCLDENEVRPGRVYASNLYIEQVDHKDGKWLLVLNRSEWLTDDLARLEVRLYHYGCEERCFDTDPDDIQPLLCDLLLKFCDSQGLPFISADDLLHSVMGSTDDRRESHVKWLMAYIALWDASEEYM
jgi:hypothetical protein